MTFKQNWEKKNEQHQLSPDLIVKMAKQAFPSKNLLAHTIIAGGCANLNIKLRFEDDPEPHLLRVYLRDSGAAYREKNLGALIQKTVPIPVTSYIGREGAYHFAVTKFMPGMTLRDLLLGDLPHDIQSIMFEVGVILSKIAAYEFPRAGFFDQNLHVSDGLSRAGCVSFALDCLKTPTALSRLGMGAMVRIHKALEKYAHLFPDQSEKHLVHADFDPANILIDQVKGVWKVTAVLDWEFSFSGSVLCDVANMLRYAHDMPVAFETSFLSGLKSGGIHLPEDWHTAVHMLNLLALLDLLKRTDSQKSPKQCADIVNLIRLILDQLDPPEL